eukprot:6211745-Pleurochrysis_carterae.AAC.2
MEYKALLSLCTNRSSVNSRLYLHWVFEQCLSVTRLTSFVSAFIVSAQNAARLMCEHRFSAVITPFARPAVQEDHWLSTQTRDNGPLLVSASKTAFLMASYR